MDAPDGGWLHAGRVGRPHGLDGSFHVRDAVPRLLEVGVEVKVGSRRRRIARRAGDDRRPIVRLEGLGNRGDAERLAGESLLVMRSQLPELDEDEWWAEDLVGCAVRDGDRELGTVVGLLELPSCEALEVARQDGSGDVLVPLVADAVRSVDVAAKQIEIDLRFLGLD